MQKDLEHFSDMGKSADSISESADSSQRNYTSRLSNRSNSIKILCKEQKEFEEKEHHAADKILEEELNLLPEKEITLKNLSDFLDTYFPNNFLAENLARKFLHRYKVFGEIVSEDQLYDHITNNLDTGLDISSEESAILLKETLLASGRSQEEILKTLIETYEDEPELKTFVENWRRFLELWKFAKDKPPTERKAIETIISNSNFTADNSFSLALTQIENSPEISVQTKLDISRKFSTTGINTVRDFDRTLRKEKQYKKSIEKKIQSTNTDIENLNNEISNLNAKLDKLPPDDPKRVELEIQIKEKNELLKNYKQELSILKKAKPNEVQFQLRNDLIAKLNSDGTRSVRIESENFTIQLPSNRYPLQGEKNLRSINVAFPFLALRSLYISNEIFAPDLVDNGVPTKTQRDMAHLILSSLGIDDSQILSEKDIAQLKNDLSHLVDDSNKTGRESLISLCIYDVPSQQVNKNQLKKALKFIKEKRGKSIDYSDLKEFLVPK